MGQERDCNTGEGEARRWSNLFLFCCGPVWLGTVRLFEWDQILFQLTPPGVRPGPRTQPAFISGPSSRLRALPRRTEVWQGGKVGTEESSVLVCCLFNGGSIYVVYLLQWYLCLKVRKRPCVHFCMKRREMCKLYNEKFSMKLHAHKLKQHMHWNIRNHAHTVQSWKMSEFQVKCCFYVFYSFVWKPRNHMVLKWYISMNTAINWLFHLSSAAAVGTNLKDTLWSLWTLTVLWSSSLISGSPFCV